MLAPILGQMAQVGLSQSEQLRRQRLQHARSQVEEQLANGVLRPDEAEALFGQVDGQLGPLFRREQESAALAEQAEEVQTATVNRRLVEADNFRRTATAQNVPNQIQELINPHTGLTEYYHVADDGTPTPMFQGEIQVGGLLGLGTQFAMGQTGTPVGRPADGHLTQNIAQTRPTQPQAGRPQPAAEAGPGLALSPQAYNDAYAAVIRSLPRNADGTGPDMTNFDAEMDRYLQGMRRHVQPRQPDPQDPLQQEQEQLRNELLRYQIQAERARVQQAMQRLEAMNPVAAGQAIAEQTGVHPGTVLGGEWFAGVGGQPPAGVRYQGENLVETDDQGNVTVYMPGTERYRQVQQRLAGQVAETPRPPVQPPPAGGQQPARRQQSQQPQRIGQSPRQQAMELHRQIRQAAAMPVWERNVWHGRYTQRWRDNVRARWQRAVDANNRPLADLLQQVTDFMSRYGDPELMPPDVRADYDAIAARARDLEQAMLDNRGAQERPPQVPQPGPVLPGPTPTDPYRDLGLGGFPGVQ